MVTKGRQMEIVGWDTETYLIEPGKLAPKLVCLTTSEGEIFKHKEACEWFDKHLGSSVLVGHNVYFDLAVCHEAFRNDIPDLTERIFDAIDNGMVSCTQTREKMIAVATGTTKIIDGVRRLYSLQKLVSRYFDVHLEKEDTWRLRYSELDDVPLADWPVEAVDYAVMDAKWSLEIYNRQSKGQLHQEISQIQASWALHLCSVYGLRTDAESVEELKNYLTETFETSRETAYESGLVTRKEGVRSKKVKYSKNIKAVRQRIEDLSKNHSVLKTASGATSYSSESIKKALSHKEDGGLSALAAMVKVEKLLKTYVPVLEQGSTTAINPYYNPILETYRTSCSKPNVQNLPRGGGVRECFTPREGHVYAFCDYSTLELRSLAQINEDLGFEPKMLDALKKGKDLHLLVAAQMSDVTYEEAEKLFEQDDPDIIQNRQIAKCLNFGLPGGMGAEKFVDYCKGMGVIISVEQSRDLKKKFMEAWPEMQDYFKYCGSLSGGAETARVEFLRSGLIRDKVFYCAVCNGFFQHLAAMGAKKALYDVVRECFVGDSVLRNARPVLFLHDEIGLEVKEEYAQACAERLQEVMVESMKFWIPDVPIEAEPVLMRRWYKGAKPAFLNGKIVPSKPKKEGKKTKWVADVLDKVA